MATTKKTTKKTVSTKSPVKKSAPKKTTAKKSAPRAKAAAKDPSFQSFKVAENQPPFSTFKITRQTVYWIILVSFIVLAQLWIIKLQVEVATLLDIQQQELLFENQ